MLKITQEIGDVYFSLGTVTSAKIQSGSILDSHITNNTISDQKLATLSTPGKVADSALSSQVTKLGSSIDLTNEVVGVLGTTNLPVGTGPSQVAAGNDSRFTDSRAPTGSAGGGLTGTYPNPTIATVPDGALSVNVTKLGSLISLTTEVEGVLPVAQGGSGAASVGPNLIFSGPASVAGAPTFRSLVSLDYPTMTGATAISAGSTGAVPQPVIGDQDKFLRGDGQWVTSGSGLSPSTKMELYDEFLSSTATGSFGWTVVLANGGSSTNGSGGAGHPGIRGPYTGPNANGYSRFWSSISISPGGGPLSAEFLFSTPAASTATEAYKIYIGFMDSNGAATTCWHPNAGAVFVYDSEVLGSNWHAFNRQGGTGVPTDTGVGFAAGSWTELKIIANATNTSNTYQINGATVGTLTNNMPFGVGLQFLICKTAGTTPISFSMDYVHLDQAFTTPR